MRSLVVGLALVLAGLPAVTAGGEPDRYECVTPPGHPTPLVHDVECGTGSQVWDLLWYYPPGVYQAWCFLSGECPCPHCPGPTLART